ncbi:hypothetical protein LP414_27170 [Polaromonas sp. P1(28)-13]|nr:hypothetical protein LP414_27170 [Polaromonas sp. P1(28)-13]
MRDGKNEEPGADAGKGSAGASKGAAGGGKTSAGTKPAPGPAPKPAGGKKPRRLQQHHRRKKMRSRHQRPRRPLAIRLKKNPHLAPRLKRHRPPHLAMKKMASQRKTSQALQALQLVVLMKVMVPMT